MTSASIVAFEIEPGSTPVLVEQTSQSNAPVSGAGRGYHSSNVARGGREVVVEQASQTLEGALQGIRPAARLIVDQFLALGREVQQIELELGIKLTAEAGAIIAKTAAEGHCIVKLTFVRNDLKGV